MNLAFVGFLPPGSANPEERTFVDLLSRSFGHTIVFQGIGVRGLRVRQIGSLPSRLMRRKLTTGSSGLSTGLLPVLPIRASWTIKASAMLIRGRLHGMTKGAFEEWVFWTRFPSPELVLALRGLPFARVVYEAVDNYAAEPLYTHKDRNRLEVAEAELLRRAIVITASSGLVGRFKDAARGPYWLPIGQDARLKAARSCVPTGIPRPRLCIAGSLDELADEVLLFRVATERPNWHLVLAGPRARSWGHTLQALPNVHSLGKLTPGEVRGVIGDCDVALNPCVLNPWTADALPVKIFDYLAEGKPIVSTPMTELHAFDDLIELAAGATFVNAIEHALQSNTPQLAVRRREMAERFTLQERAQRATALVSESRHEVASQRPA